MRTRLTSPFLNAGVLAAVLPTLLVTPLQADVILLHSHCDGKLHLHRLTDPRLRGWFAQHANEDSCCDSDEDQEDRAKTSSVEPIAHCRHKQHFVALAKGTFLASPLSGAPTEHLSNGHDLALPAMLTTELLARRGAQGFSSIGAAHALAHLHAVATLLLRNHALLL